MKTTKAEQRMNNAFCYGEPETFGENSFGFVNGSGLSREDATEHSAQKADVFVKILKRAFIFLPGALYLFFGAMFGFSYEFFWENPITIFVVFLIGAFMTIFGIGDVRNPKYLAIPLSIVAVGIMGFSLFSMFGQLKYLLDYGIYFFPLALIVLFLAKDLADRTDNINRSET